MSHSATSSSASRCALITGASRGIGQATAIAFAEVGVSSILVGRSVAALQSTVDAVQSKGVTATAFGLNLQRVEQVKPQISQLLAQSGPVDILVNNAGMALTAALLETSLADWQQVLDLNLTAPFQCIQAVLPQMRAQGHGTIINVISVAGRQAFPEWGAYCASKFGLMGLTKTLAQEEKVHGIRVIALCPGAVNTPLWDSATVQADFDRTFMLTADDVAQAIVTAALMPQHVVVDELVLMPNVGTF